MTRAKATMPDPALPGSYTPPSDRIALFARLNDVAGKYQAVFVAASTLALILLALGARIAWPGDRIAKLEEEHQWLVPSVVALVRAKCVELTPEQIALWGVDCAAIRRAPPPTFEVPRR
jgi:hypothetical protein